MAECYDWKLRRCHGNGAGSYAGTVFINLPGSPNKISGFMVQARFALTPHIKNGECLDEKTRGKRVRKVQFFEPQRDGKGWWLLARVRVDGFDLAKALVDEGFGRSSDSGAESLCIR
ncbi:MAG TPA: hypothetical protein DCE33_03995 [Rhodospirillaceae bacterium]|nr:hypothetical protein [Rhodospirillaceae bacterium]